MRKFGLILVALLLLVGCGRKELPQPLATAADAPLAMGEFTHSVEGTVLKLGLKLTGGNGVVGYQVDRAEIDPACGCPGAWRRYYELPPLAANRNVTLEQLISLKKSDIEYAFRVRAIDSDGRLGAWSDPIRAKVDERVMIK